MRRLHEFAVVALALGSCAKARPQQGTLAHPVSWQEEVSQVFAANCNSCHSGPNASGGYRTTSYLEALGPTAAPVAVAGDANSLLLKTIDPATADATHMPVSGVHAQATEWVVPGRLSLFRSGIHEGGILNPNDPAFHKHLVAENGWNFSQCQGCHGVDLQGGAAGVSCQECHSLQVSDKGVATCTSCHGDAAKSPAPPRDLAGNTSISSPGVGAHQAHLAGKYVFSAPIACGACHQVPAEIGSAGHIDTPRTGQPHFSGLAVADGAQPAWNGTSCSNTYCHGGGTKLAGDTEAQVRNPVWTGSTQAYCGSCHGLPPSVGPHAGIVFPNCAGCHSKTITSGGALIFGGTPDAPTSFHLNGVIDVDQ